MTEKQLCRISQLLFTLDTYLFQEPDREDLCREIAELQKAMGDALKNSNPT